MFNWCQRFKACLILVVEILMLVILTHGEDPMDNMAHTEIYKTTQETYKDITTTPEPVIWDVPEDPTSSHLRLRASISDHVVDENAQVSITCEAFNVPRAEFLRFVRVNSNGQLVTMATNKVGEQNFKPLFDSGASQRYRIDLNVTAEPMYTHLSRFSYRITIKPTQVEDSGVVGCTCGPLNATAHLTVQAFPQSLELNIPDVKNKIVQVQRGMHLTVECRANSSHPKANVVLTVGSQDLTKQLTVRTVQRKEEGTVKGLDKIMFDTILSGTIVVQSAFDEQKVQCKARLDKVDQEKLSKSITIKTGGYPPSFKCHKVTGYNGQKNVIMRCDVKAKPKPTFKFYWSRQNGNETITLHKGGKDGHYSATVSNAGKNIHEYKMELRVDRVFPQMFRNHTFEARNILGTKQEKVLLRRVASPFPSSAPRTPVSVLATAVSTVLLVVLHH